MVKRLIAWFRQTFAPTAHEQQLRKDRTDKQGASFGLLGGAPAATHRGEDHWVE
jgi:hypothetical protein